MKSGDEQIQINDQLREKLAAVSEAHQKNMKALQSELEVVQRQLSACQSSYTAKSSEAASARLARNRAIAGLRAMTMEAQRFNVKIPQSSKRCSLLSIDTHQVNVSK